MGSLASALKLENVVYEKKGPIAYVTLNRPKVMNALNKATINELRSAFEDARDDLAVRGVILTGGEKAFAAGADIAEIANNTAVEAEQASRRGQALTDLIENLGKPVMAAVNGFALGGGCELAMSCTIRIAAESARFGQPEVKLGILPGYGGTQRLPRLVGRGRALELLLSGETISAAEAHRIGLVNAVVPQPELLNHSRAWLGKVLANAPVALGLVMEAVDTGLNAGLEEGLRFESAAFGVSAATEDRQEGTRAFLEKR